MTWLWGLRLGLLGAAISSGVLVAQPHSYVGGFLTGAWAMIEVYELGFWWTGT